MVWQLSDVRALISGYWFNEFVNMKNWAASLQELCARSCFEIEHSSLDKYYHILKFLWWGFSGYLYF